MTYRSKVKTDAIETISGVQVRVSGTPDEVRKMVSWMKTVFNITSISREYVNTGTNIVRVYVNVGAD